MRKIVIHKPGSYDRLQIEELPDPSPKRGEVLIKTQAIGVNYADCCIRWGVYKSAKEYVGWPITPGFEFSGTIAALGEGAQGFSVGEKVFGVSRFGGYSSHVVVPDYQVFPIPRGFSMAQAGAFPAVFMTAYHALFQNTRLRPGMKILVHSAAGGVGTALLQLARVAGVMAVGVVGSPHKVETAKSFGATHVIDKSSENLRDKARQYAPEGYDLILDANGHTTLKDGFKQLRPTGRLVTYGYHSMLPKEGGRLDYVKAAWGLLQIPRFSAFEMCDTNKGVFGFNISFLFDRRELLEEGMTDLLKWAESGKIQPPLVNEFAFERVADAHRKIESGTSVGKLVLTL